MEEMLIVISGSVPAFIAVRSYKEGTHLKAVNTRHGGVQKGLILKNIKTKEKPEAWKIRSLIMQAVLHEVVVDSFMLHPWDKNGEASVPNEVELNSLKTKEA